MSGAPNKHPSTTLILGAGPSGLGTAMGLFWYGYKGKMILLEKNSVPGGLAGSFKWKKHQLDYGPHRISPNLPTIRTLVSEILGPDCLVAKSRHGAHYQGRLYQFPVRFVDWIHPLSIWTFVTFLWSYLWHHVVWITRRFQNENFEQTITRKFGRRFYRQIAQPMAKKVWGSDSQIDPSFVNQRFSAVQPWNIIKKMIFPRQELYPESFYYPRYGFGQFWTQMAETLPEQDTTVAYNTCITSIEVQDHRICRVRFRQGGRDSCIEDEDLRVISTIPISRFVHLLEGMPKDHLVELTGRIKIRSLILVYLEFKVPSILPYRNIQFPERDFIFNRLFEQNQYSRWTVEEGKSVIGADITAAFGSSLMNESDEDLLAHVKRDLSKLRYIPLHQLSDTHVKRLEYAYVVPDVETRLAMHDCLHRMKNISNVEFVGRFATGEYDNSDYAVDSGMTLASMLVGRLSRADYLCAMQDKRQRVIVM